MGAELSGSGSSMGASRGSRGSPEVGSRRVTDTSISRIFFFFLGVPNRRGMPWCTLSARVRPGSAASRLLVAIVWVSGIYAASTAGIFFNLYVVVWCDTIRVVT